MDDVATATSDDNSARMRESVNLSIHIAFSINKVGSTSHFCNVNLGYSIRTTDVDLWNSLRKHFFLRWSCEPPRGIASPFTVPLPPVRPCQVRQAEEENAAKQKSSTERTQKQLFS